MRDCLKPSWVAGSSVNTSHGVYGTSASKKAVSSVTKRAEKTWSARMVLRIWRVASGVGEVVGADVDLAEALGVDDVVGE